MANFKDWDEARQYAIKMAEQRKSVPPKLKTSLEEGKNKKDWAAKNETKNDWGNNNKGGWKGNNNWGSYNNSWGSGNGKGV